jgi:hypothetical protein
MQPALDLRDVGAVEVSAVSQFLLAEFALVPEAPDIPRHKLTNRTGSIALHKARPDCLDAFMTTAFMLQLGSYNHDGYNARNSR